MPKLDPKKKKKAFRMRLQRVSMMEIARTVGMSMTTLHNLEHGRTDKKGVRHRGWREELERMWAEEEKAELESGLALKSERVKAYKELADQAIKIVKEQFPNITMKSAADAKALLSEIRELNRLIAIETGQYRPGGGTAVAVRTDITINELEERYEAAQAVVVDEITPPREAHYDAEHPDQRDA